jgi:hypothetical protein
MVLETDSTELPFAKIIFRDVHLPLARVIGAHTSVHPWTDAFRRALRVSTNSTFWAIELALTQGSWAPGFACR